MFASKLAAKGPARFQYHTYSIRDRVVMHSLTDGWAERYGVGNNSGHLELGEHPISEELAALDLSRTARSGRYVEGAMTKLYAPDKQWNADALAQM